MDNKASFIPKEVLVGPEGIQQQEQLVALGAPLHIITPKHVIASQGDWVFFTLAPVISFITYRNVRLIDFDLIEQFESDMRRVIPSYVASCIRYRYAKPVFRSYPDNTCTNADILWCLPKAQFEEFKAWLCAQAFTYTSEFNVKAWRIQTGTYTITDPLDNQTLASITLFLPETEHHFVGVCIHGSTLELSVMRKHST